MLHVLYTLPECEEEQVADDMGMGLDSVRLLLGSGVRVGKQIRHEESAHAVDEQTGCPALDDVDESPDLVV